MAISELQGISASENLLTRLYKKGETEVSSYGKCIGDISHCDEYGADGTKTKEHLYPRKSRYGYKLLEYIYEKTGVQVEKTWEQRL